MLADDPLDTVLRVTDLDTAHRFYHQQLGHHATAEAVCRSPMCPTFDIGCDEVMSRVLDQAPTMSSAAAKI